MGVEGGHAIGGSLGVLRTLYQVGVRYLTLTSTCDTPWAECASTDRPESAQRGGLTPFGKVRIPLSFRSLRLLLSQVKPLKTNSSINYNSAIYDAKTFV